MKTIQCLLVAFILALTACNSAKLEADYPNPGEREKYKYGSILGQEGFTIFDSSAKKKDGGGSGIGVNAYLWRASLDTISFMPVTTADPFGGTILTDWYSPPETPNERTKVNIYILDRQLRADGVRVSVFRQMRDGADWHNATVAKETVTALEDAILTKARQLRIAQESKK